MPKYGFTDREAENASKLRSFEAAEQRGIRSDRAREKMDFDQQYKLGEAERRAQESAMRATAAMERSAIMEQQLQLQKDAAALKQLKEETNLLDTARATQDKIGFIKATRDLREDDEQFDQKLSDAMATFPNAQKDEFVQKRLGWLTDQRKGHLERKRLEPVIKNMDVKGATVDGVQYQAKVPVDTEKARLDRLAHLEGLREKTTDSDVKLYLDEEITKVRNPVAPPAATPASGQPGATPAPAASPAAALKPLDDSVAKAARAAIAAGKDAAAVAARLKERGYDPSGL